MKMQTLRILLCVCMLRYGKTEIFDPAFERDLDRFIEHTMGCRHIPGLSISVVKDSKTWTRGYGKADFSQGQMVDNTTQFVIGSVTKSFTMVLLGILLTEKGLDWNAKISNIMGPNYTFIDEYRSNEMTLRDLLSHRTGLAGLNIALLAGYPTSLTRAQFSKNLKYWPQALPFRDAFLYNNFMNTMLGHVAEKLGGDTWENLVTSKVLQPIGMTSSRILKDPRDVLKNGVAKPYIFKDNMFQNGTPDIYSLHTLEPAGAIISTAEDMAKYMRFNLKGGITEDGKSLLDRKLFLKAFTATTPTTIKGYFLTLPEFPVSDTTFGYGYGWFTGTYRARYDCKPYPLSSFICLLKHFTYNLPPTGNGENTEKIRFASKFDDHVALIELLKLYRVGYVCKTKNYLLYCKAYLGFASYDCKLTQMTYFHVSKSTYYTHSNILVWYTGIGLAVCLSEPVIGHLLGTGTICNGYRNIWHSGGVSSYATLLWMFPDINAGIYGSINGPALWKSQRYGLRTIISYIADNLIKKEQWLNETNVCEFPQLWQHKTTHSTRPERLGQLQNPSEYVGNYGSLFLPGLNISTKSGDNSSLLFQMNRLGGVLHSTQDKDRFLMELTTPWEFKVAALDDNNNPIMLNSRFLRNKEGVVRSLEVQFEAKVVYTKHFRIHA